MIFLRKERCQTLLSRKIKNFSPGFSLLEILLTISILALSAGILSPIYFSMQTRESLETKTETIVSSLRRAQILSMSGEHDSSWGLKVLEEEVVIFKGLDYLSRDVDYDEIIVVDRKIITSGLDEFVFNKISGDTDNFGDIRLDSVSQVRNINVNKKGIVSY